MLRVFVTAPVVFAIALFCSAAPTARANTALPIERADNAEAFTPGEYVWAPELVPDGPIVVYVDLSRQLVTVYRNGVRIGVSTASSGRRGYETPTGVFTILQKNARHRSNLYDNAPMPFMMRLTWDGIALHGGAVPARPASHGCIRLPMGFARELFRITPMGATVVVVGEAGVEATTPVAGVLAPVGVGGAPELRPVLPPGEAFLWTPHSARTGPVSIVMSLADQNVVVLRNGVEIGRARASIPRTSALSETQIDASIFDVAYLPSQFRALVLALGASPIVVTDESVSGPAYNTGPAHAPLFDMQR